LLGIGPFDVAPDSTLAVTIAFVAGADLHTDTRSYYRFFDPMEPHLYREQLGFANLVRNARWAGWVYDTPGFDTDGDGHRGRFRIVAGDTLYFAGDGVPDFQGPPPPPAPTLRFETSRGLIMLRWNGKESETAKDPFSHDVDFEGYRVYMSRTGHLEDFALLAQRDNINFIRYRYRPSTDRWVATDRPFTLDSLQSLYTHLVDSVHNFRPFHPDSFKIRDLDAALQEIVVNDIDPSKLDTNYYCFERFDANDKVDDTAVAIQVNCCGQDVRGIIRKRFPFASPVDTVYEQGTAYPALYEYEYAIDGLQIAEPVYLGVTAFDFGDPAAGISSLESSPQANAEAIWPISSAADVISTRPKPIVYPNPYRLADAYNATGWEDPQRAGLDPERARRVTFVNVPDTCTISIWSLDGDLVRRWLHAEPPGSAQATVAVWNLITRNTQAVKTGIYIWSIESRFGTDIGKLVIIK
jgi:hypothetical protein